jgi:hypothetical protein
LGQSADPWALRFAGRLFRVHRDWRLTGAELRLDALLVHFAHQNIVVAMMKSFVRAPAVFALLQLVIDRHPADQKRGDDSQDNKEIAHIEGAQKFREKTDAV